MSERSYHGAISRSLYSIDTCTLENMFFPNECRFTLFRADGRSRIYRRHNERHYADNCVLVSVVVVSWCGQLFTVMVILPWWGFMGRLMPRSTGLRYRTMTLFSMMAVAGHTLLESADNFYLLLFVRFFLFFSLFFVFCCLFVCFFVCFLFWVFCCCFFVFCLGGFLCFFLCFCVVVLFGFFFLGGRGFTMVFTSK